MNKTFFTGLIVYFNLISCSSLSQKRIISIGKEDMNYKSIKIFTIKDSIGEKATDLGVIKYNSTLFLKKCGFENAINKLKKEAFTKGGNSIQVLSYKAINGLGNGCHKIKAKVLFIKNINEVDRNSRNDLDIEAAIIYIYRYSGAILHKPNLYLNDSIIFKVKSNFKSELKIFKEGKYKISLTDDENSIFIDSLKIKKKYYLRVGMESKNLKVIPKINFSTSLLAELEYKLFRAF